MGRSSGQVMLNDREGFFVLRNIKYMFSGLHNENIYYVISVREVPRSSEIILHTMLNEGARANKKKILICNGYKQGARKYEFLLRNFGQVARS